MLTLKQSMKLSAIVGKLNLQLPAISKGQDQFGAELLLEIVGSAYKAEKEIITFIADYKGCTVKDAEELDLVEVLEELSKESGVQDFFLSVVESQAPKS